MGVRGLLTYIKRNRSQLIEEVDLIELARQRPQGLELLIDLGAFLYKLTERMPEAGHSASGICMQASGDYQLVYTVITNLVNLLRQVDIKLVFVHEDTKRKRTGIKEIQYRSTDMLKSIICDEKFTTTLANPPLLGIQVRNALRACECEMIRIPRTKHGSSSTVRMLHQNPNAYAILTNDTGFCVFKDAVVILLQFYDLLGNLVDLIHEDVNEIDIPQSLLVGIITQAKIQNHLQLQSHADLVDLSIIGGNEETQPYLEPSWSPEVFIDWIRQYHDISKHHRVVSAIADDNTFSDVVEMCRLRYTLQEPEVVFTPQKQGSRPELFPILCQRVTNMQYCERIIDMHEGNYFQADFIHDSRWVHPHVTLYSFLRHIFEMVMDPEDDSICVYQVEYHADEGIHFAVPHLDKLTRSGDVPLVSDIDSSEESLQDRFSIFVRVATDGDESFSKDLMQERGPWAGFKLYLLRLFLRLNVRKGLFLGREESLTIAAAVLSEGIDTGRYTPFSIKPSAWSVTILNSVQVYYRYLYELLGSLLFLSHLFPEPRHIFPPVVWNAFLLSVTDSNLPGRLERMAINDKERILYENRELIDLVTEGIMLEE